MVDDVMVKPMDRAVAVEGVGAGSQACRLFCRVPLQLENGDGGHYHAPIIPNYSVPALLGLKALTKNRAVLDCFNFQLHFVGPGEIEMKLPLGSRTHKLELSESGHLLLPVASWLSQGANVEADGLNVQQLLLLHATSS